MTREVTLEQYLPEYLRSYKEIMSALKAENPEFNLFWRCANQAFENAFIDTADEYGIGRLEKMLGLFPMDTDTLEIRRIRVKIKWNNTIPYTLRALKKKLGEMAGESNYLVDASGFSDYRIGVDIINRDEELCLMILEVLIAWIPANMVLIYRSIQKYWGQQKIYMGTALSLKTRYIARPMTMNKHIWGTAWISLGGSLISYTKITARPERRNLWQE